MMIDGSSRPSRCSHLQKTYAETAMTSFLYRLMQPFAQELTGDPPKGVLVSSTRMDDQVQNTGTLLCFLRMQLSSTRLSRI